MSKLVHSLTEDESQELFGPGSKFLFSTEGNTLEGEVPLNQMKAKAAELMDKAAAEGLTNFYMTAQYPAYLEVWASPDPNFEIPEEVMEEEGLEEAGPITREQALAWF